ncbi:hypothetical protein PMAYCL1PPCAC_28700, partial [Pristionchus mayeri]
TAGQKIKDIVRKATSSTRVKRDTNITSRPIKEKTLDRFMERVKARQESRIKSAERTMPVRESECVFPNADDALRAESIVTKDVGSKETTERQLRKKKEKEGKEGKSPAKTPVSKEEGSKRKTRTPSKEKKKKKKENSDSMKSARSEKSGRSSREKSEKSSREKSEKSSREKSEKSSRELSEKSSREKSEKSLRRARQSPLKQIQKIFPDLSKKGREERRERKEKKKREKEETARRKSREKNLFVNGRPFWVVAGKMSAEEKAEMTQDDLPLNAAIILEVRKGNIDLPVLPDTVIKFDQWAPLEVLQGRDETLFNHKMLFANTIRSMINSTDFTGTDGTTGE